MIKFDHKIFYNSYAYDYYLYKLGTLKAILVDVPKFDQEFLPGYVQDVNRDNYIRFIKSELRMTCFHAIETLFELIFALEPKDGLLRDEKILQSLTAASAKTNYARIGNMAKDLTKLDFLDVICEEDQKVPVWLHIFYFKSNFQIQSQFKDELLESGKAIRYFLYRIAKIFSNRSEYNAYKHGIRIMNTLTYVSIGTGNGNLPVSFDMKDTMSLFSIEKDDMKKPLAEIVDVISFDTDANIEIIRICYYIIHNIISCRRAFYVDGSPSASASMFVEAEFKRLLAPGYISAVSSIRARNPIKD